MIIAVKRGTIFKPQETSLSALENAEPKLIIWCSASLANSKSTLRPSTAYTLCFLPFWPFWGGGPGVGLVLCCFVVCSAGRFVLCLTLCSVVLVFFGPFGIAITSLGEKGGWSWCFSCVFSICACLDLSVSSSSWCLYVCVCVCKGGGEGCAVCDCGTPWTFLLPIFLLYSIS